VTFQELIFALEKYWHSQGCIIQQPYDMEVGRGHFSSSHLSARAGTGTMECSLRSAVTPSHRRPLWLRTPTAFSTIINTSDYETVAG